MKPYVSYDREEETPEAKARWFQSLSLEERMAYLCAITDLILENNPEIIKTKYADAKPTSARVCILTKA